MTTKAKPAAKRKTNPSALVGLNVRMPPELRTAFVTLAKRTPDMDAAKVLRAFIRQYVAAAQAPAATRDLFDRRDD